MRKLALVLCGLWVVGVLSAGVGALLLLTHDVPESHADIEEHFKYGSIGSEARAGVPDRIWYVLPKVFPDLLPPGPGEGYERLGFIYEPGHRRPIGTSHREKPIGMIGLNCGVCHISTVRDAPDASPRIVLAMPANQLNLRAYLQFLRRVGQDPRFNADTLIKAMREDGDLPWWQSMVYRYLVIPRTKDALGDLNTDFAWADRRPLWGPGRVDTFNPYKVLLDLDIANDDSVGTSDLPTIWNQRPREGIYLHWDGNNSSVAERNKSAAIGAGATPESLDLDSLQRIQDWIYDLPAPPFPADKVDRARAAAGERVYARECASCHDFGSDRVGQVVPVAEIGTDGERVRSFTPELAVQMNTIGSGLPWRFNHFRKTDGYVNAPLDGVWLRAPYLHNGSIPTMRALLFPSERPAVFYRGYDVYDYGALGFVSTGPEAERVGFRYDTSLPGNANTGHVYGAQLSSADKLALIEYLKTK